MFLCQGQGPVGVVTQSDQGLVHSEGRADQEQREEDERGGPPLDPGASNVKLLDDDEANNEAEQTLMGEVC